MSVETPPRRAPRRILEIDVVLAERLKDIEATLKYGFENVNARLDGVTGRLGSAEAWQDGHASAHGAIAAETARREGADRAREDLQVRVTARDQWRLGLQLSAVLALGNVIAGIIVKLLLR